MREWDRMNEEDRKRFFSLKMAALFHDPPDKPWHIHGRLQMRHEDVRDVIVDKLKLGFLRPYYQEMWGKEVLNKIDVYGAQLDRWFTELYEEKFGHAAKITLGNILSGEVVEEGKELQKPEEDTPTKWVDKLNWFIQDLREKPTLLYQLLYTLYEPLYYAEYPNSTGPADTRCPHHTVFDHVYMSASLANWFSEAGVSKPTGLLVHIDLAGVQPFIQSSRKFSDLWASSWFISGAIWYMVQEFVEHVGPDVLLIPTCRWNPFYYRWLLGKLSENGFKGAGELKGVLDKFQFADGESLLRLEEAIPLIPETSTLLLPPYHALVSLLPDGRLDAPKEPVDGLGEYFLGRYREFWRALIGKIKEELSKHENNGSKLVKRIKEALDKSEELGVTRSPPLTLRVVGLRVEEVEGGETGGKGGWLHYARLMKKLEEGIKSAKYLKGAGWLAADFPNFTEQMYKKNETYSYCTVCGCLPAVFSTPRRGRGYEDFVPEKYRAFFDEGEHFCPYCLIKRLASTIAKRELAKLVGGGIVEPPGIPTIDWHAISPFLFGLSKFTGEEDARRALREDRGAIEKLKQESNLEEERGRYQAILNAIDKIAVIRPQDFQAKNWTSDEIEALLSAPNLMKKTIDFARKNKLPTPAPYLGLVMADADSFGEVMRLKSGGEPIFGLSGRVGLSKSFVRIIERTGELDAKSVEDFEKEVEKKLEEAENMDLGKVCPSYHALLTRTLMLTALRDSALKSKLMGERASVIYAGGDDLFVLTPPLEALRFVLEDRKRFSEGDGNSFHQLYFGNEPVGHLQALGECSRSYAIVLCHHKYPLGSSLRTVRAEEKRAKNSRVESEGKETRKDALAVCYLPGRGGGRFDVVLPLKHVGGVSAPEKVRELLEGIQAGDFTHSLPYDLGEFAEIVGVEENGGLEPQPMKRDQIIVDEPEFYSGILKRIMERNASEGYKQEAEKIAVGLRPTIRANIEVEGKRQTVLLSVCEGLRAMMVGLRG